MQETEHPWRNILCAALIFCAVFAIYVPSVSKTLIWDDVDLIGSNSFVTSCANLPTALNPANLIKVLPVPMSARPMVNASIIADTCGGNGPAGMKLTNILLHAFNAAGLFFLLLTLSGFEAGAFFGALLFAVHPAVAETVHIITFRSHLLGSFFFIFSFSFSLFFSRRPAALTAVAAALCYFLALLSIETPLILPLAVLLTVYFDSGWKGLKKTVPLLITFAVIGLFFLWFWAPRSGYNIPGITTQGIHEASRSTLWVCANRLGLITPKKPKQLVSEPAAILPITQNSRPASNKKMLMPWREVYFSSQANLFTMSRISFEYLITLFTTLGLNTDYNPEVIETCRRGLAPLAAVLAVLAASVFFFLKKNIAGLGMLLAFTALLPVLNIAPIYNIKAGRYLYLPLVGIALAALGIFQSALRRQGLKRAVLAAAALWVCGLAAETIRRNSEYKDNFSFFSGAIRRNPRIPRMHVNLSRALLLSNDCPGALRHIRQAAELDKANPTLRLRLAFSLAYCGHRRDAIKEAEDTLKLSPGDTGAKFMIKSIREGRFGPLK